MIFSKGAVGIDIGTENIKVVHAIKSRDGWIVKRAFNIKNPLKNTIFLKPEDKLEVIRALQEVKEHLPDVRTIISVPGQHLIFRFLQFPKLKKRELEESIYWESQEFSSIFENEYVCDFEVIEEQKDICRVLLVGTRKSIIMDYIDIVQRVGFDVYAVDVNPLAVSRVIQTLDKVSTMAVIDAGAYHCEVTILEKGRVFYNRNLSFSGQKIKDAVMKALQVDQTQAESLIMYPGKLKESLEETIFPILQEYMAEIQKVFDFYENHHKGQKVDKIVLVGGTNKIWCMKQVFKEYFKKNVFLASEIGLKFADKSKVMVSMDYINYMNALGLAMRR